MSYRTKAEHTVDLVSELLISLTTEGHEPGSLFDGRATAVIRTGSCWVQTYLTADECRSLARSLLAAAVDLDRIEHERLPEAA